VHKLGTSKDRKIDDVGVERTMPQNDWQTLPVPVQLVTGNVMLYVVALTFTAV